MPDPIDLPDHFTAAVFEQLDAPRENTAVNKAVSGLKTFTDAGRPQWTGTITRPPGARNDVPGSRPAMRLFAAALEGQKNTFKVPVFDYAPAGTLRPGDAVTTAADAAAGDGALALTLPPGRAPAAGDLLTVNSRWLHIITEVETSPASFKIKPKLRADIAAGAAVEWEAPWCVARLTHNDLGSVFSARSQSYQFDVLRWEEALEDPL